MNVDFRDIQPPARSQGDRGTCVGFAVSAAHEWLASDDSLRSPEDAMWAAHQIAGIPGREEVAVEWALIGLTQHEHATEVAWPYSEPKWHEGRPPAALDASNRRGMPTWERFPATTFDRVSQALGTQTAVVLTVQVVPSAWKPDGVVDAPPARKTKGAHAVLVVGATPARIAIKNSWGPRWGDEGFGWITRRYVDEYGVIAHAITEVPT